jgi:hypothetical protein
LTLVKKISKIKTKIKKKAPMKFPKDGLRIHHREQHPIEHSSKKR